jgi:hypothetical protein
LRHIYYIGFYFYTTDNLPNEKRTFSSAAVNLMNFISEKLSEKFYVTILSPSWTKQNSGFFTPKKVSINKYLDLELPPSIGSDSFLIKSFSKLLSQLWLLKKILILVKKDDKVLVYHSIANSPAILIAKFLIRFKIILQLNEIYQDVNTLGTFNNFFENVIINKADAYILSTKLLVKRVSKFNRKFSVCEGVLKLNRIINEKYADGKIHLVYAGLIDKKKLCAFNAIDIASSLSENYVIHIIGFGSKADIDDLLARIENNNFKNKCKIYYDGFLEGENLFLFLQKCHIGLVAQSEDKKFTESSFPSKIYTYLTNNLIVVCLENELILSSPVCNLLYRYNFNSPELIAHLIADIDLKINHIELYRDQFSSIENSFKEELYELIG